MKRKSSAKNSRIAIRLRERSFAVGIPTSNHAFDWSSIPTVASGALRCTRLAVEQYAVGRLNDLVHLLKTR